MGRNKNKQKTKVKDTTKSIVHENEKPEDPRPNTEPGKLVTLEPGEIESVVTPNPLDGIDLKNPSLKTGERYILQTNLVIIERLDQILKAVSHE